jgi:hypothetical protein
MALAALALCGGCFGGRSEWTEGYDCLEDGECGGGLVCQYGCCRRPCSHDDECPDGGVCIASLARSERESCVLEEPPSCVGDDSCADGQVCTPWFHDGLDERLCALGADLPCPCPSGTECVAFPHDSSHRVCTLPRDEGCEAGCPGGSGLVCAGGVVCREGCEAQRPCSEGYECVDGACVGRR